jgi:tRNA(Ile)-lysidine synthase
MALALALLIESENKNVIPIVVDHGLQPESAQVTLDTIEKLKKIGYKQIETAKAQVIITDGLEASARRARYQIFNQFIDAYDAKYFLLATSEDILVKAVKIAKEFKIPFFKWLKSVE